MSDEDSPLGTRQVPQYILDGLVEDSKNLRKAAERIERIMSTPESLSDARVNSREMWVLCETCLAAVINLFDLTYPSRPRVDLRLGYEFHSGPVGFITGGLNQQSYGSGPYRIEIDELPEEIEYVHKVTVSVSHYLWGFLDSFVRASPGKTRSSVIEEALGLLQEREIERVNQQPAQD